MLIMDLLQGVTFDEWELFWHGEAETEVFAMG